MGKYVAQRILLLIPTLLILSLLVFTMMRILPGDVAFVILSSGGDTAISEESLAAMRELMGLNRPLPIQFLEWLWDMVRLDLGTSLFTHTAVSSEIGLSLPVTFEIALLAKLIAFIGIPMGIISAIRQNSWMDLSLRFWAILFLAVPGFWLGLMVMLAGGLYFDWVPPIGYNPIWVDPKANLLQMIWPSLILGVSGIAVAARMSRSTMLEVMREDYIRTARAKGLKENVVIVRHALKNTLIPIVTLEGLSFAGLMGGTVILEQIFAIPGMGRMFIQAIIFQDYPMVQGVVMVFAVIFMLVNLLIDILYGWMDPRIRYN